MSAYEKNDYIGTNKTLKTENQFVKINNSTSPKKLSPALLQT